ncbi:cation:proton antiporter [Spirulina sp. 06S082]|uniref:cation:proton antiporter domain-containing protein n=1 Tax=Spirulina sp. 06S082 TaxID=3110248 RepID=UPI002B2177CD|nr:cation:proton antiporter [Spirulina sp. 06S082]MEA5470591.1 cation:proton antiporter [Spirulina sp. 06S082]
MENLTSLIANTPLIAYTVLLLIIFIIPPIFEGLRLPGLVGLLVAGIAIGPSGLNLINTDMEIVQLLSDAGKIYLMFVAGLEIDLSEFRKTKDRSLSFGLATFLFPMIIGTLVGHALGLGWNASILIGSLLASHTLLAYPIVERLGVARSQAVTVTIGATIFTDIAALLVLAICVSIHQGAFSPAFLFLQLGSLAIYSLVVLFGFSWAGKEYFRRSGDDFNNQFLFILLVVFLASVGAQLINIDKIVGAFLVGLAVNDVVGHSPVEERVEFVGATLFIPFFFLDIGLILDIPTFVNTLTTELVTTVAIVGGLFLGKFLAALTMKWLYRYSWYETLTMWSLSLPQVAATLAAALVGVEAGLISELIFNTVIVLMLVTAILGPILTARFARNLPLPEFKPEEEIETNFPLPIWLDPTHPFTVLVPLANPFTKGYLIEMGALLAGHENGKLIALSIAKAYSHLDDPEVSRSMERCDRLLSQAMEISKMFAVEAIPEVRIDDEISAGIVRSAREHNASLIIMGWGKTTRLQARLFGNLLDRVLWSAHCPVAAIRLLDEPVDIHRILIPVKDLMPQTLQAVRFARLFADSNQGEITFLHICDRQTPPEQVNLFVSQLSEFLEETTPQIPFTIQTSRHEDIAELILKTSRSFDLVVLRSIRRRTVGGLTVSDTTTRVISKLNCSLVLIGEPSSL